MEAGKIVERTLDLKRLENIGRAPGRANDERAFRHHSRYAAQGFALEWRSKDAVNSMLFFSLLVVVVFSFSFDPSAEESRQIAGGLIWVAFLFAAVVALNQTWAREIRTRCWTLTGYRRLQRTLYSRLRWWEFYFCQRAGSADDSAVCGFLPAAVTGPVWQLALVAALGTWALVVNGTFFAAMSLRTRSREIMLPLLLFPIRFRRCSPWCRPLRLYSMAKARVSGCIACELRSSVYNGVPAAV